MAHDYHDRVKQLTQTQGTAAYVLAGAVAGYRTFADAMAPGDTTIAAAIDATATTWEIFVAELVNSTTLMRSTVLLNSFGGTSQIDWPDEVAKEVFCVIPASRMVTTDRENKFAAHQFLGAFGLRFGEAGLSEIRGSDAAVTIASGASVTFTVEADGTVRVLDEGGAGAPKAFVLQTDVASPADGHYGKELSVRMPDASGDAQTWLRVRTRALDVTAGSIAALGEISVARNGAITPALLIDGSTGEIKAAPGFTITAGAG